MKRGDSALATWVLPAAVLLLTSGAAHLSAEPPRTTGIAAFGEAGDVHLLGLDAAAAERALAAARASLAELEALLDPDGSVDGGFGRLNLGAGGPPVPVAPAVLDLTVRSAAFCRWTNGITSLLGGKLYGLWGLRQPVASLPGSEALSQALASTACDQLVVNPERSSVSLGAGSRLDPWGFALGAAVDRVVDALRAGGAANGMVSLGMVARGFGPGPGGRGWQVVLPAYPGLADPLPDLWLRDRALAAASPDDGRLGAAGEWFAPYLDLVKGRPAEGILAVLASAERAVEAQGLATAMFATGSRSGQLRLGNLWPRPSVLWILGSGEGRPLLVEYRWADLQKPTPRAP
jgi:thiamine biosynthesis lipoprotein